MPFELDLMTGARDLEKHKNMGSKQKYAVLLSEFSLESRHVGRMI